MIKLLLLAFLITGFSASIPDQPVEVTWRVLQKIDFTKKYVEEVKGDILFPKFTPELKKLHTKRVQVKGFTVPIDETGEKLALSAYPYASCFFCGKAGPASVMTVKLKKKKSSYRIDQWKTFEGILLLNESDIHEFYYVLKDAVEVNRKR